MSMNSAWTGASPHIDKSDLMCHTGCGFFGNPAWNGYCSKCFKEQTHKRQKRPVFDPTNLKIKVSRSVSDVSEFQSKATSLVSKKLDRFDEKSRQQLGKRTKAVKEMFRKSNSAKGSPGLVPQLSTESQIVTDDWNAYLKTLNGPVQVYLSKLIGTFIEKIQKTGDLLHVDHLADHFHDLYSALSDAINTHSSLSELPETEVKELTNLVERFVTTRLHRIITSAVNAECEEKDLTIQNRIRSLIWVTCSHLECKIDERNNEVALMLDNIITDLIEIDSKRTPGEKLGCLVSACHSIMNALKISCDGSPASADDFLPALIFCVLRANPPLLHSNITFITNYAEEKSLQSGETGYFFTNLCCAVSFIEKLTAESLSLTDAEFDHYMSGDALPVNALDDDYMCEGLKLMNQNCDSLNNYDAQLNTIELGYNDVVNDFDQFKERIINDIENTIKEFPLVIRRRTAEIDEPDPTQELLPPPLQPQSVVPTAKDPWMVPISQSEMIARNIENPFSSDFSTSFYESQDFSPNLQLDPAYFPSDLDKFEPPLSPDSPDIMYPVDLPSRKPTSLPYTGFKLQGEMIPSIPCDTGASPFSPQDPFSPPIPAPSQDLPPPLVPSPAPAKKDSMDKVVNVLGELASTFDKLL